MSTPKPPKEIWVNEYFADASKGRRDGLHHYRLVKPRREPRPAIAYVVKNGSSYLYTLAGKAWDSRLSVAERWITRQPAEEAAHDLGHDARVVKLVRKTK